MTAEETVKRHTHKKRGNNERKILFTVTKGSRGLAERLVSFGEEEGKK